MVCQLFCKMSYVLSMGLLRLVVIDLTQFNICILAIIKTL